MKIDELDRAEEVLGYQFKDRELLRRALRHASCTDNKLDSNERLEFLGDAILGMVICDHLYEQFPQLLEGELTKIKSTVVSRDTCARIARRLGLDVLIELGKGMRNRGEIPRSLAAGGFEAVIGALYLEAGLERARTFILEHLSSRVRAAFRSGHQQNFKSVLQQVAQQKFEAPPMYVLLDEKGPDHAKCFEICVKLVRSASHPVGGHQRNTQSSRQRSMRSSHLMQQSLMTMEMSSSLIIEGSEFAIICQTRRMKDDSLRKRWLEEFVPSAHAVNQLIRKKFTMSAAMSANAHRHP